MYSLLNKGGKVILIVVNDKYIKDKLSSSKDLFIEKNNVTYNSKSYNEVLHYSDIPSIGKVIDYNREDKLYVDLFKANKFSLYSKEEYSDNGFICTIFVFEKVK